MSKNIFALLCLFFTFSQIQAEVIYVNLLATGQNNGSSWSNAYKTPRVALAAALYGDEVWVTKGSYNLYDPSGTALILKSGVRLYGGFNGTETLLEQRDWQNHETILTAVDANMYTLYKILYCENTDSTTVLDGFTVTKGFSSYSAVGQDCTDPAGYSCHGGGLLVYSNDLEHTTSLIVRNCKFSGCLGDYGGGMAVNFSNGSGKVIVTGCHFEKNASNSFGGGLFISTGLTGHPVVTVDSCFFSENFGKNAPGVAINNVNENANITISSSTFISNKPTFSAGAVNIENYASKKILIQRCEFLQNKAGNHPAQPGRGGAILGFNFILDQCSFIGNSAYFGGVAAMEKTEIYNCLFAENYAGKEGGVLWLTGKNILINNSFYNNRSLSTSGVIQNNNSSSDTLINCIFWNNRAASSGNFVGSEGGLDLFMEYCLIDADSCAALQAGLFPIYFPYNILNCGSHNLWNLDPAPRDTANGDYRLSACSPVRNVGDSIWVQRFHLLTDRDGLPRILEGRPDIGAYETLAMPWTITTVVKNASAATNSDGSAEVQFVNGGTVPYSYQWSNGAQTMKINDVLPGIYQITIADSHGCDTSLVVEVGFTVSTKDAKSNFQASLVSNLLTLDGHLRLSLQTDFAQNLTLFVVDILGRLQLQTTLNVPIGSSIQSVPVQLINGVYYLYLQDAHIQSAPLKFLVRQ